MFASIPRSHRTRPGTGPGTGMQRQPAPALPKPPLLYFFGLFFHASYAMSTYGPRGRWVFQGAATTRERCETVHRIDKESNACSFLRNAQLPRCGCGILAGQRGAGRLALVSNVPPVCVTQLFSCSRLFGQPDTPERNWYGNWYCSLPSLRSVPAQSPWKRSEVVRRKASVRV